ncbi:MAG: hypothetical protein JNL92_24330 [Opitutaceae bacterium]|nr:hypothetical protein [Opitutaceae bacterium]
MALLPDALFFTRAVPVTPGATPAEAATQIELAVESVSPFPLAQLYYGAFWQPGQEQALVFAAYRRRFTAEQTAAWSSSELVLPAFAAVLGAALPPATTVLLPGADALTGVHWGDRGVPARVVVLPLPPEATDADRATVREALLRELGGSKQVLELAVPPEADAGASDHEIVFRAGEIVSRLPAPTAAAMDVRDKAELALLRNARRRDVLLWRVALGAAAALLLLGIGELALMGGRAWQQVRVRQYQAQKPGVDRISGIHELTSRIEDLATKRLLPMEMLSEVVGFSAKLERKPEDILFTRMTADQTRGLYTLVIEGRTNNSDQVNAYETSLKNLPSVQSAQARFGQVAGDRATFTLTVVFKPDSLKPIATAVATAP